MIAGIFDRYFGLLVGVGFNFLHGLHLYTKVLKDIPDESNEEHTSADLKAFAVTMIQYGEILLNTMLSFLNYNMMCKLDTFKFLFNELLDYNKRLSGRTKHYKLFCLCV